MWSGQCFVFDLFKDALNYVPIQSYFIQILRDNSLLLLRSVHIMIFESCALHLDFRLAQVL